MKRRSFISTTAKASVATTIAAGLPGTVMALDSSRTNSQKMIGIQIGAVSFYDEGVEQVLDNVTGMAGVNKSGMTTVTV